MSEYQKSGILISIRPPYAKMLLSGYKPMEFRKKIINELMPNVGENLPVYIYETKNNQGQGQIIGEAFVSKIYNTKFTCANNAQLRELYFPWMRKHQTELTEEELNIEKPWLNSEKFNEFKTSIGYPEDDRSIYAIAFRNLQTYKKPKELSKFLNKNGTPFQRPPQNMCYVYKKI